MNWDFAFQAANFWALAMWVVLIALPRSPFALSAVLFAGVGLLCFAYTALLVLLQWGALDANAAQGAGPVSFFTIEGVRNIFLSDGGVTVGWMHYLAFDLFVGLWIAKDADHKAISRLWQAPVLLLTFIAGPAGLLWWLAIREKRARASGRGKVN